MSRKMLPAIALFALAAAAPLQAAPVIDVRLAGGGTAAVINPGDTVTVEVYVTLDPGSAGLGSYSFSLVTRNETHGGVAWPVDRTPTDTVLNVISASFDGVNAVFTNRIAPIDDVVSAPPFFNTDPDPNDEDIDVRGMGAGQPFGGPFIGGLGAGTELLLGSVTFKALDSLIGRDGPLSVDIQVLEFTNANGSAGGLVIKELTGTAASPTGTSTTNIGNTAIFENFVTITVAPIPEPATMAMLGLGGVALLRRRVRR